MAQSKLMSFVESWANVVVGFGINWTANMLVFPLFGYNLKAGEAFAVGLIFTVISVVRSYTLRRWFNNFGRKA